MLKLKIENVGAIIHRPAVIVCDFAGSFGETTVLFCRAVEDRPYIETVSVKYLLMKAKERPGHPLV